jgi:hypothetical protein
VNAKPEILRSPKLATLTIAESQAARAQLERMLAHPLFKNSNRYAPFLRYVVEHALSGDAENLKERTLGIQVFGRPPDYDTGSDPVVRVTAGETRRRIAQYYFEAGHEADFRIELPPGSYVPELRPLADAISAVPLISAPVAAIPVAELPQPSSAMETTTEEVVASTHGRNFKFAAFAIAAVILIVATITAAFALEPKYALDQFWSPVLTSSSAVVLALPSACGWQDKQGSDPGTADQGTATPSTAPSCVGVSVFSDASALTSIAAMIRTKGYPFEVRETRLTTYSDLRAHPAVLVGGLDNPWTMKLSEPLRFSFKCDHKDDLVEIVDNKKPGTVWTLPGGWERLPSNQVTQDYGLISRVHDSTTDQFVVVAAGLGAYGTMAAAEVLSNEKYMENIVGHAPRDWAKKNLQVVVSTEVINGTSGPPRVVATEFW